MCNPLISDSQNIIIIFEKITEYGERERDLKRKDYKKFL
tara:strand:+ start:654 stop:770 length:117 start_codon:yes stop_codon:yes gene_type:complete